MEVKEASAEDLAHVEPQVPKGYKQTEVGVIPEDWDCVCIESLASPARNAIVGGPFGSDLVSADYVDEGVPVIRGQNMGSRELCGPYAHVSQEKADTLRANLACPGDLVFTQRGTLGQVSLVPEDSFDQYVVSQSQMKVTLNLMRTHAEFLYYWFESEGGQKSIEQNTIQTGVPHINLGILRGLHVPNPARVEQLAIAAALSDADALIDAVEQLLAKKRQIKQGAMQELLTGKRRLPGCEGAWEVTRLGECLLSPPAYGINAPSVPYSDQLPPYLRITDITDDGRFASATRVSVDHRLSGAFQLASGDIVFARTGASVGKSYLFRQADGELVFAGFLIRIRTDMSKLNPSFLSEYAKSSAYWEWVRIMSMRSGQPGINGKEYAELPISLPPIGEQTAIATLLSDMDAEIAALEEKLAKAREIKQGMMQELLTGRIRLV